MRNLRYDVQAFSSTTRATCYLIFLPWVHLTQISNCFVICHKTIQPVRKATFFPVNWDCAASLVSCLLERERPSSRQCPLYLTAYHSSRYSLLWFKYNLTDTPKKTRWDWKWQRGNMCWDLLCNQLRQFLRGGRRGYEDEARGQEQVKTIVSDVVRKKMMAGHAKREHIFGG